MADTKWSQFPSATPDNTDVVVGLHSGDNARFTIANIVAAVRNGLANIFVPKTDVGAANGVASLDNTGKVPTSQLPSSTGPEPATATPLMDGAGAVGVSTKYAREDHEHPSDTNKQTKITANGILKGDGAGGVSAATAGTDYQAPLTIDPTPTASSTNPVQSGGVYTDVRTRVPNYGKGQNILRNWYFVGGGTGRGVFPVNQRGVTSGTTTNNSYSIDAWKWTYGSSPGSWSLVSGGISISPSSGSDYTILFQELGNLDSLLNGKNVTASVLYSDGQFASGSITRTSGTSQVFASIGGTWVLAMVDNSLRLRFGTARTMVAVKLELGTEQTLAHQENGVWVLNDVPDYEYELYRCITSTADSSDTYANKSLATEQQLAYVETGTTASRNYTAGQYISLNGLLYTADTAIASGATFYTSGGNKNLTECVGGGFNNLGGYVQTNSTEATVRYVKIGKMVVVSAYGTYVSNNRVVLGDIPDPFITQFAIVYRNSNSGGYSNAMVFQENGTYKLSFYGATPPTNTTFVCSFSYVCV